MAIFNASEAELRALKMRTYGMIDNLETMVLCLELVKGLNFIRSYINIILYSMWLDINPRHTGHCSSNCQSHSFTCVYAPKKNRICPEGKR